MNSKRARIVVPIVAGLIGSWIAFQVRPSIGFFGERLDFFDVITWGKFLQTKYPEDALALIKATWVTIAKGFFAGAVAGVLFILLPSSKLAKARQRSADRKVKVLFLSANPESPYFSRLRIDEEVRAIMEKIRAAEYRGSIELFPRLAARPDDLLQALNEIDPQIVHFSGHGGEGGEIFLVGKEERPHPVRKESLVRLFQVLRGRTRVVVLNACYSQSPAEELTETIDCAIGMSSTIGDDASIIFAASFYRAISFGKSLQEAYDQGVVALGLEGVGDEDIPKIHARPGVKLSEITLL
jgi:hypothetical protein